MKILHISDWHHNPQKLPKGKFDLVVVSGDMFDHNLENFKWIGNHREIDAVREADFQSEWAQKYIMPLFESHKNIVCVAGNHDFVDVTELFPNAAFKGSKTVEVAGIKIGLLAGTTIGTGEWSDEINESEMRKRIYAIDRDIDILVSHQPPYRILDKTYSGQCIGSTEIYRAIYGLAGMEPHFNNLKAHLFGHVHEAKQEMGEDIDGRKVIFSNASGKAIEINI